MDADDFEVLKRGSPMLDKNKIALKGLADALQDTAAGTVHEAVTGAVCAFSEAVRAFQRLRF